MLGQLGLAMFVILNRRIIERKALGMQSIVRHACCHDHERQDLAKICMYITNILNRIYVTILLDF